jgi:hypothetical protein
MDIFETQSFGAGGVLVETGTTPVTGNFCALQVLSTATFSAFAENNAAGDVMTGIAIPAGTVLWGHITAFTLTSGAVRAYRKAS